MQSLSSGPSCTECSTNLIDAGDEFVCPKCGIVDEKEVVEGSCERSVTTSYKGGRGLGSFMGSLEMTRQERFSKGLSKANSTYEYLKAISDFAGRQEGPEFACLKMLERVSEKLGLPSIVLRQASAIAKKIFAVEHHGRRITIAAVSAYSLIAACKIEGITSASVREVITAHADLGRCIRSSSVIQLALESPIRTTPRSPEEYLTRILARLSKNNSLCARLKLNGVSQTVFFKQLRENASKILREIDDDARAGRRPCGLAASSVYSAEMLLAVTEGRRRRITQREVASCGDAAEYTIRGQCAQIFKPAVERLLAEKKSSFLLADAR
jgi:transcription initiation factor TFIIIB Brf1 subunit/transcription initiation factor TFIIB